jgi:hypothetical protein
MNVRRILLLGAACAALCLAPRVSQAQVFGQWSSAEPVAMNTHLAGGYLSFTGSEAALLGQLRLSFYPNIDFGFQGGLGRVDVARDTRTSVKLGGDLKGLVMRHSESNPMDLSLGAAIGIETAEDFTLLGVGPSIVASRHVVLANQQVLVPYVGASLLFSRVDQNNVNVTDLSMPLRFGAEYRANAGVSVIAEMGVAVSDAIRDDLKFTLGANFPF